jgi:hypothetical protein
MIYRKAPLHPPKKLLRVVSVVGAGAVLVACSSSDGVPGSAPLGVVGGGSHVQPDSGSDAASDATDDHLTGSVGNPDAGGGVTIDAGDGGG